MVNFVHRHSSLCVWFPNSDFLHGPRAYSAAELKKKLIGKKYPLEIVDRVISDFQIW